MTPILKGQSIDVVQGQWMAFSDEGLSNTSIVIKKDVDIFPLEAVRNYFYDGKYKFTTTAWNKLINRDFLMNHHLMFREKQLWEDVLWWFFVMKHLSHLYIIPDFTYFYCKRDDSINKGTSKEERLRHQSVVSDIISTHFTHGEESREAVHYGLGFLYHYLRQPKTKELRATARRFSKALPFRKYPVEKTLLCAAIILPHNHWGRQQYKHLAKWLSRFQ